METPIDGGVVGVPTDYFFEGGDEDVKAIVKEAIWIFEELGASVEPVTLPDCHKAYDEANATFSEIVDVHRDALADDIYAFSEPFRTPLFVHDAIFSGGLCEGAALPCGIHQPPWKRSWSGLMCWSCPPRRWPRRPSPRRPPEHDKETAQERLHLRFHRAAFHLRSLRIHRSRPPRGADDLRRAVSGCARAALRARLRAGDALA